MLSRFICVLSVSLTQKASLFQNHSLGRRADAPQGSWAGASRYMIRRRFDYFVRHLLGAEPPAEYVLPQEEAEQAGQYE